MPHFELVFFLTMEAFGRVHPIHRNYAQWDQMSRAEQELHLRDMAEIYILTARRYEHSAIFIHSPLPHEEDHCRLIDEIRRQSGDEYFLMMHGDATYSIPTGEDMMEFCGRLMDEPRKARRTRPAASVDEALARGERFRRHGGLDGFALCSDYCFNTGPFFSPDWFDEFVTPYLADLIRGYRQPGLVRHQAHRRQHHAHPRPAAARASPTPCTRSTPRAAWTWPRSSGWSATASASSATSTAACSTPAPTSECVESARYALKHGMPGGRYIFSTSNCVYTGMDLRALRADPRRLAEGRELPGLIAVVPTPSSALSVSILVVTGCRMDSATRDDPDGFRAERSNAKSAM